MRKFFSFLAFFLLIPTFMLAQNISDVIEDAMPSVVTVAVYNNQESYRLFGFKEGKSRGSDIDIAYQKILNLSNAKGSGSGFIVERNGKKYVVTNAHVVETASDRPGSIYIFSISQKKYRVKVLGGDSFYDVAVLEFIDPPGNEITSIDFRKSGVRVGESVYAIGTPLGKYPYSVSDGIISGKNRVRDGVTGKFGFLQSTATIIWGNSGGPLIDTNGKVVGINSQIEIVEKPNQSFIQPQINFALESKIAEKVVNDVINNHGFVKRSYLGAEFSQRYKYNSYRGSYDAQDEEPVLSNIIPGSPASASLKNMVGATLLKINNTEIRNVDEALGEMEKVAPGETVKITLKKNNKTETFSLFTKELDNNYLADMANFILGTENALRISNNQDGIFIKIPNKVGSWRVMSAGISFDNFKQMWMVKNLGDLGAALRFAGMYGVVDFFVANLEDVANTVQSSRVMFSGKKDIYKIALWY
ncbi:MAG TPA: trypsin-like peptidase domain-containing protein, partial [Ignavibacteriaceae bacterium]|nr:trypsin-like peptidase domain-containing protein [Ignavibacteriaceae bacterium]